ncbi:glycosyltransferase [Acuticoccus yangtzensis]|uniref:glycosyltransferase n=1 Tax=Acuticoccus yangtzensis TaxID=1443441 RepID=UPI000B193612|nr:glycosyltransferase [Acuticoccus yangtzensis]
MIHSATECGSSSCSVIVCTYNGRPRIHEVLTAVKLAAKGLNVDLIVVDNNSIDGVGDFCREWAEENVESTFSVSVIQETLSGTSYARRAGVRRAKHDTIIFVDDDNIISQNYLKMACEIMTDRSVYAVGGAGVPEFETPPPAFVYNYLPWLACGAQFRSVDDLFLDVIDLTESQELNIYSAGLAVYRPALERLFDVEGFPVLSGRVGTKMVTAGEDIEYIYGLSLLGGRILSCPSMTFIHKISASRLNPEYFKKLADGNPPSARIHKLYAIAKRVDRTPTRTVRSILRGVRAIVSGGRASQFAFEMLASFGLSGIMTPDQRRVWAIARECRQQRGNRNRTVTLERSS